MALTDAQKQDNYRTKRERVYKKLGFSGTYAASRFYEAVLSGTVTFEQHGSVIRVTLTYEEM